MEFHSLSPKQKLALSWWNQKDYRKFDAIICDGAVRSGKTVAMTAGFFLWSMTNFSGRAFGICGRTVSSLRRNVIRNLQDWIGDLFIIHESISQSMITVIRGDHRNDYYLFGGQDESSYKLIQGITLAGVFLDEVALMPRSFVEQACARCSVTGSKFWFNCNPEGPEHWFYKEWICKCSAKNAFRLHFVMADNPGLSQSVVKRYYTQFTGVFFKRYILGQWVAAEGLIYEFGENHITEMPSGPGRYYISVDYGTMNPFSAGLWWVGDRAVRIREFYYDGRKQGRCLTDEEYYNALEELAGGLPIEYIIIDPSAASLITLIRRRGRYSVRKAKNGVLPGIRLVSSLLKAGKLQFCDNCKDTIREFSLYRWSDEGDVPVKEFDHAMDDVRYFCMAVMNRGTDPSTSGYALRSG